MTQASAPSYAFDADARLGPVDADGAFTLTVSDRWNALGGVVNGGYLMTLCVRALHEILSFPDPLVVSAHFLRPVAPGPARIRTSVARLGRRTATGEASLYSCGKEAVRVIGTFTEFDEGPARTLIADRPPDLPAPEDALDLLEGSRLPAVTMADRIEYRVPALPGWLTGRPSGDPRAEFWMRFRDGRDADALALPLLVDAAAPVVLELGVPRSSTIELTVQVLARPAPGWLSCRATTRHLIGRHHDEDFQIWDSTGLLVAQSRQLALARTASS